MRAGLEIVVWCVVLFGLTVVLISSVSAVELAVAGVAAVGGAFAARGMRLAADPVFRGGARGAARAVSALPTAVLRGLAVLVAAMAHYPDTAVVRRIHLKPGTDAGWAGVLLAASPDTCVIDVPGDNEVVLHALGRPGPVEEAVAQSGESQ